MRLLNAIARCHFISYLLLRDYNERDFILTSLLHRSYIIFDLWVIKVTFFNFFLKVKLLTFFCHGFVGYYTSKRQRETEEASS